MDIWHYHPQNRRLMGQGQADASPLEPGVFLLPAFATDIPPPNASEAFFVVFTGDGWALKEIPSPPEPEPEPEQQPAPPPLPTITRRQLRLALMRLGVTGDQVEAQIAAMPGTPIEREAAMIEWRDSSTYERNHPLVVALGAALGLTAAQIDNAWREAATI